MNITDFVRARIDEDEARAVREATVKRAILKRHFDDGAPDTIFLVVELMALAYSDHPDYDEEWSPGRLFDPFDHS